MAQRPQPPLKGPTGPAPASHRLGFDILALARDGITHLVPRVLIDGLPLVDASVYALDVGLLLQSQVRSGTLFILTCWCGVPECVGIDTGVTVRTDADTVTWDIVSPPTARGRYRFERNAYDAAIAGLCAHITQQAEAFAPHTEFVPENSLRHVAPACCPTPMATADFARVVNTVASRVGGRVGVLHGPGATPNFAAAEMRLPRETVYVLRSVQGHWACAASFDPSVPRLRFVTCHALAKALGALEVHLLSPQELQAPFRRLPGMSEADIRYWQPTTLGEGLFNWWD